MSSYTTPFTWLSPNRRPANSRYAMTQPPAAPCLGARAARDNLLTAAAREMPPVGGWWHAHRHPAAFTLLTAGSGRVSHNKGEWGPG